MNVTFDFAGNGSTHGTTSKLRNFDPTLNAFLAEYMLAVKLSRIGNEIQTDRAFESF